MWARVENDGPRMTGSPAILRKRARVEHQEARPESLERRSWGAPVANSSRSSVDDDTLGKVQTQELHKARMITKWRVRGATDWLPLGQDLVVLNLERLVLAARLVELQGLSEDLGCCVVGSSYSVYSILAHASANTFHPCLLEDLSGR